MVLLECSLTENKYPKSSSCMAVSHLNIQYFPMNKNIYVYDFNESLTMRRFTFDL